MGCCFLLVYSAIWASVVWHHVAAGAHDDHQDPAGAPAGPVDSNVRPPASVNCGGHYAETCHACPAEYAWAWCNAECVWVLGDCRDDTLLVRAEQRAEALLNMWSAWMPFCLVALVGMPIYAYIYRISVVSKYPLDIPSRHEGFNAWRDRETGIFAAFTDPSTCMWAFFCTPVLAAKNYKVGQVLDYWPSCFVISLMYSPLFCLSALARTVLSARLKRNLRYESNFVMDCTLSLLCFPCEVGRESLEVDEEECMRFECPLEVESTWVEPPEEIEDPVAEDGFCFGRLNPLSSGAEAEAPLTAAKERES